MGDEAVQIASAIVTCKQAPPNPAMLLTPAEAEKLILENLPAFPREDCPLDAAHGRVLRGALCADRDLPPFDRVTLDGFALRSSALPNGVRTFRVEGVQAAGMRAFQLGEAEDACLEVMTGAVLPAGADCVVPYEETSREGARITIAEPFAIRAGNAIHQQGSDHRAGEELVAAGTRLGPREIAVAAAVGTANVTVALSPKIAVIATGDELVDVGSPVAPHQIRRSNDYALRAALIAAGYPRIERFHLRDVRREIEHRLWHILAEYDVVLITGGVSKGKFDFLPAVLDQHGVQRIFQGVAQRPGKPFWFGVSPRHTPVFALPGNPVSACTCLTRYVLPALAQASGARPSPRPVAVLDRPVSFKPPLAWFLPVALSSGPRAERIATPHPANTSGDFSGLVGTDGFIELPPGPAEFAAGTIATFWAW